MPIVPHWWVFFLLEQAMNLFSDSDEEGHEGMFLVFGWWTLKLVNSELSVFIFRKQIECCYEFHSVARIASRGFLLGL